MSPLKTPEKNTVVNTWFPKIFMLLKYQVFFELLHSNREKEEHTKRPIYSVSCSLSGHMGQYIHIYNMFCCQCWAAVWCCVYHSYRDWSLPKVRYYLYAVYSDTAAKYMVLSVTFISVE